MEIYIPEDFFRKKIIKKMQKGTNGNSCVICYLKMLIESKNQGSGTLTFKDDFCTHLALEIDEPLENVKSTCHFLIEHGFMHEVRPYGGEHGRKSFLLD